MSESQNGGAASVAPAAVDAPGPGQKLKAERLRRALSTQKLADDLHLDPWVIEALEANDYQRIGPPVYAKGHLKRYAALLGVSDADLLVGFDTQAAALQAGAARDPRVPAAGMRAKIPALSTLPWLPIAGCMVLLVILIGVIWMRPAQRSGLTRAQPVATTPPAGAGVVAPAASAAPPSGETQELGAPPSATGGAGLNVAASARRALAESADTAGGGRAQLRMSFSADSWVDVRDASGRRLYDGLGRANSVKTVAGAAPLRVQLGFASGVQLEINQHAVAIGPQFLSGDIARFDAGADGVLRRDRAVSMTGMPAHGIPTRGEAAQSPQPRG